MKNGGRGRDKGDVYPVLPEKQVAADGKKLGYRWPKRHDGTPAPPKKSYPAYSLFPGIHKRKKRQFLAYIAMGETIESASKLVGMSLQMHWFWKNHDEEYVTCFEQAEVMACDISESRVYQRGFMGYDRPVIFKGKITAWYKDYSDALAMFWLKGKKPGTYRDSLVGLTSNAPVAIQINLGVEVKQDKDGGNNGGNNSSEQE